MDNTMKRILLLAFITLNIFGLNADTLTLKAGHPDTYVVKKGDTLWDISGYFLQDPWRWATLWGVNPQIANPHLIYPGDRLTLVFIDGQPRLVKKQHIKKGVEGRVLPKDGAIPAIDLALIEPYLVQNRVVEQAWLDAQPMVLSGESPSKHHILNDVIYVNSNMPMGQKVAIYEHGREFLDSQTGELLGREIILTASGRVTDDGDISKVQILSNLRETEVGYSVIPVEDDALMSAYFTPTAAELDIPATVIATVSTNREAGKLEVVYLDKGLEAGVKPGHVFAIYRDGEEVVIGSDGQPVRSIDRSSYDKVVAHFSEDKVFKVPDVYHGNLMVFKVFDKTSLGLIMMSDRPVRVKDKLLTPANLTFKGE